MQQLTIAHEIISQSGRILFTEGQKVKVKKIDIKPGFFGRGSGVFYPPEIIGVRLEGYHGIWFQRAFKEKLEVIEKLKVIVNK